MVTAVKSRKSKPLPLVDLFRKPKSDNVAHVPALGSGVHNLPPSLHTAYEPYTPNTATLMDSLIRSKSRSRKDDAQLASSLVKPDIDTDYTARSSSRSRSLSRDTRTTNTARTRSSSRSRSYSVGEQSPISTYAAAPPVPSIPLEHQLLKAKSSPISPHSPKNMDMRGRHRIYDEDLDDRPIGQLLDSNIRSRSLRVNRSSEPYKVSSPTSKSHPTTPIVATPSSREHYIRDRQHSTSSSSDEDDNIPLAATNMVPTWFHSSPQALQAKLAKINKQSLLDDEEEEDDEDHIPIAALGSPMSPIRGEFMTAADKYKEKVRERIFGDKPSSSSSDEQDDNMPIQQAHRMRQARRQSVDDVPRGRRSRNFFESYPEEEHRGRSRSRSRIPASEKPCRNRPENDIPPVPRLPSVYNV
ncbi:hypothetical protein INT43_002521 [Umbelopsis isabellina]|uniref:Uncharacterized protein n=1 Tax=Mortierella isabellina TaxID=91625 RepID=A0A8H7UNC2_MORIS|nr:hypothetical protein INT43_002521 [Umbelopsis isabellina]